LLVNQRIPHKKVLDIFKKYKKKAHKKMDLLYK
jgi:hypothetical protein